MLHVYAMPVSNAPKYAQLLKQAGLYPGSSVIGADLSGGHGANDFPPASGIPCTETMTPQHKWLSLPMVVLDFETYYDQKYRLGAKGMTYAKYMSAPQFRIHGLAIRHPDGRSEFRTDAGQALRALQSLYGRSLEKALVVMHNAMFDASILKRKFDIVPANIFDTMLATKILHGVDAAAGLREMAKLYGLPDKGHLEFMGGVETPSQEQLARLSDYAVNDANITYGLAAKMLPRLENIPMELWAMEFTVRNSLTRGFAVDLDMIGDLAAKIRASVDNAVADTGHSPDEISGDKSFRGILAGALARTGREIPMKPGAKGPIPALSKGDPAMQALLCDTDPDVRKLAGARQLIGSASQMTSKLSFLAENAPLSGGIYYPQLKYHEAVTGRFAGGGGFNVQNISSPSKTRGLASTFSVGIRGAIRPPEGFSLVAADACQIEARVLAFMAAQHDLHMEFAAGTDVYSRFASDVLGVPVRKTDGRNDGEKRLNTLRNIGKEAVLGLGYGMGVEKFIGTLKAKPDVAPLFVDGTLNTEICARIVHTYRDRYPKIRSFWHDCENAFLTAFNGQPVSLGGMLYFYTRDGGVYVRLPSERSLAYTDVIVKSEKRQVRYIDRTGAERQGESDGSGIVWGRGKTNLYGGKLVENIIQAVARDILVDTMFRIEKKGWPVVLHIHDEIICMVCSGSEKNCLDGLVSEWRRVPAWIEGLVLDAEGCTGKSLYEIS